MSPKLAQAFADGRLVRPSDAAPNLVHLVRAVASSAGVPDLDGAPVVQRLIELIGPRAGHLIFVLLDGLGINLVRALSASDPQSFVAKHLKLEINATSPSTTACALNSVTTAQYPNRHGVAGWFTYLPEFGLSATMLPFQERFTSIPLTARGIGIDQVLTLPPIVARIPKHTLTIVPALLSNTTFNNYTRAGTEGFGYASIHQAIDHIIAHVRESPGPTYTHLYLPEIDTQAHHAGVESSRTLELVRRIDAELSRLHDALRGSDARIIVTADHGLIDVPKADQALLFAGDPLLEMLIVPPTGDARMPVFHVREGRRQQFIEQFEHRFAERMILLSTDDVEQLELFGPGKFSAVARPRFGDFIGIAHRAATLSYHPPNKPVGEMYLAVHAGLSPQEMWIPMCVA